MTYQVLIVDDEPIILSGIKFLIDWEKNGCAIAGTARNGRQALDMISELKPHIVICDISMPVMSGIDLIKTISAASSLPVFIMLTNYGEFDLARDALRCQAVDYLLKSQLEPELLEKSLAHAKKEYEKRGGMSKVSFADNYIRVNKSQIIAQNLTRLIASGKSLPAENLKYLEEEQVFSGYRFLQLFMDFSTLPGIHSFSEEETARLFAWEKEVVEKLCGNIFPDFTVFDADGYKRRLTVFCWNLPEESNAMTEQFFTKLCAASGNITQVGLSMTATDRFDTASRAADAIAQMQYLGEYYYNKPARFLLPGDTEPLEFETVSFTDTANKLAAAIRTKNIPQCLSLLSFACELVSGSIHRKKNAWQECTSLYRTVSAVLSPLLPEHQVNDFFTDEDAVISQIPCLSTRNEVCLWLESLGSQMERQLKQLTQSKSELAEKARRYVIENIDKRILLQDVADYVNLSPNYLSALFKKEYNQNFVEFMNETKIEKACALIGEGSYRMYEISYLLGFDNAYYFTKVFKKHTGMTPTEYQRKVHPGPS